MKLRLIITTVLTSFVFSLPSLFAIDPAAYEAAMKDAAAKEDAQDWNGALSLYERLYETGELSESAKLEHRKKFELLRPKAPKNRTLANANVWRVRAFIVKELDFTWEENGETKRSKASYSQEEIDRILRCLKGFEYLVWDYSDGWIRIEWTCEVVEKTLTELTPIEDRFFVGPVETLKILPEIEKDSTETIMVFAKTRQENATENDDVIPLYCFGAAMGRWDPITKGATYIAFHWEKDSVKNEPDGEAMLHEWLHSLQWALDEVQKYPMGLTGDPDGGRFIGEERDDENADPCYRRDPKKEKSWIGLYRHILQTHTTRNMLKKASPR